jgi:hypothetical protein
MKLQYLKLIWKEIITKLVITIKGKEIKTIRVFILEKIFTTEGQIDHLQEVKEKEFLTKALKKDLQTHTSLNVHLK